MFLQFFLLLRSHGLPVSLREYLSFLEATLANVHEFDVERFYALAKASLVKHEKFLDVFDRLFEMYFEGKAAVLEPLWFSLPDEWLRKIWERQLTEEEKALIEAMGGLEKLLDRLRNLLEEQKERHEGGNRWIGTGGTSPFGAYGYNPEGIRIGGGETGRHRRAVKVWRERRYRHLAGDVEINTRNISMALRHLRILTREGRPEE
ncbi:MAG: VWA domain-containing protein, partial [Bacteroidia bacterium]|nr:VWA domain-containing protein [Bacteroidia bacterium]MDW8335049.1 VWA domain-containing protein [Bacteroidia bacterium]